MSRNARMPAGAQSARPGRPWIRLLVLVAAIVSLSAGARAQNHRYGPLFGVHSNGRSVSLEGGFAVSNPAREAGEAGSAGIALSMEVSPGPHGFSGPRISTWATLGISFGASMGFNFYREGGGCFMLRPELGIGLYTARLVYGYNLLIPPKHRPLAMTHELGLQFHLPIWKRSTKDEVKR